MEVERPVNRQPKGVPTGGEFAANAHDEAAGTLAPGGAMDTLSPRGFISDAALQDVVSGLDRFRAGEDSGWYEAGNVFDPVDPDTEVFVEVSAAYDDAYAGGDFDRAAFYEEARSIVQAHQGWNEDSYPEPSVGERAAEVKGKPVTEVNRLLRGEFKQAQSSGYLPEGVNISVKKSAGGSPRVHVAGVPEEFRHRSLYAGETTMNTPERMRETPEFQELDRRVKAVARTFATPRSDPYSEYDDSKNSPVVVFDR